MIRKMLLVLLIIVCMTTTVFASKKMTEIANYNEINSCYLEASGHINKDLHTSQPYFVKDFEGYKIYQSHGNNVILIYYTKNNMTYQMDAIIDQEFAKQKSNEKQFLLSLINAVQLNQIYISKENGRIMDACIRIIIENNQDVFYSEIFKKNYVITKNYISKLKLFNNSNTIEKDVMVFSIIAIK